MVQSIVNWTVAVQPPAPLHPAFISGASTAASCLLSCLRKLILALYPAFAPASHRYALLDAIDMVANPFFNTSQTHSNGSGMSPQRSLSAATVDQHVASALDAVDDAMYFGKVHEIIADLEAAAAVRS
jgi:hypothetical protein